MPVDVQVGTPGLSAPHHYTCVGHTGAPSTVEAGGDTPTGINLSNILNQAQSSFTYGPKL